MTYIENIKNTKVSHLFVAFSPSLQLLSSLSSFSSGQKSIKNLRPHYFNFLYEKGSNISQIICKFAIDTNILEPL